MDVRSRYLGLQLTSLNRLQADEFRVTDEVGQLGLGLRSMREVISSLPPA
jgi:hypothetical protein